MSEEDLDLSWNKHEWQQYYRLRQVVEEQSKAVGMGLGGLMAFGAYRIISDWHWPEWAATTGAVVAFLVAFVLVMRELDLDR